MSGSEQPPVPADARGALLLVVEDSDTLRDVLEVALGLSGYHVVCAGTAEQALELARTTPGLGLAIIDVTLPGESGTWLVDELERESLVPSWILMSGFPRASLDWLDAWRPQVDVVEKPFRLATLTALVADQLRRPPG
jgi:DNA-binding response OmpR family regulator